MAIATEQEFTVLYREHYADVLRFVQRRVGPADADDIVGDTFLTAWRRRAELPSETRPWLFRTARNVMLNQGRGSRRQRAVGVRIATWAPVAVPDGISRVESRLDLAAAWQLLKPRDQEVLALRAWDGLTDADAAAVLGCTRATFTMRLTRARRRLAQVLDASVTHVPITLATAGWEQP